MRILIVHSSPQLQMSLRKTLEQNLFTVDVSPDCTKGLRAESLAKYHLTVVEHRMPINDAASFCDDLRRKGRMHPILVLLSSHDSASGTICLEHGADDFMNHPISFVEFMARVRSLLRRPPSTQAEHVRVHSLVVDLRKQIVTRSGKEIFLTRKEYSVLEFLALHRGAIVSKAEIVDHVWGDGVDPLLEGALETHVYTLRRKIEKQGKRLIQTIIGRGYRLG